MQSQHSGVRTLISTFLAMPRGATTRNDVETARYHRYVHDTIGSCRPLDSLGSWFLAPVKSTSKRVFRYTMRYPPFTTWTHIPWLDSGSRPVVRCMLAELRDPRYVDSVQKMCDFREAWRSAVLWWCKVTVGCIAVVHWPRGNQRDQMCTHSPRKCVLGMGNRSYCPSLH